MIYYVFRGTRTYPIYRWYIIFESIAIRHYLASSPDILYLAAPLSGRCVPGYSALLYQDKGNRAADRANQTSRRVDWRRG